MACMLCADLRGQTPPPQLSKFTLKTKIGFVHPGKQKFSSDPLEVFFGSAYACCVHYTHVGKNTDAWRRATETRKPALLS